MTSSRIAFVSAIGLAILALFMINGADAATLNNAVATPSDSRVDGSQEMQFSIDFDDQGADVGTVAFHVWFAGSDDYSNLTFDVYLGSSSNPTTLVADDITNLSYKPTSFENQTLYFLKIVATDSSGSKTSSIMNFTYHNTAPTATITSISPQIVFRNFM